MILEIEELIKKMYGLEDTISQLPTSSQIQISINNPKKQT